MRSLSTYGWFALYAYASDTKIRDFALLQIGPVRLNPRSLFARFYIVICARQQFVAGDHEAVVEWTEKALRERTYNALRCVIARRAWVCSAGWMKAGRP